MVRAKLIILVLIFLPLGSRAQESTFPLRIVIGNEATAIPFTQIFTTPVHPSIQLGTEFEWRESRHFRLYPIANVGYIFHKHLFQGIYMNGELGFDFKTGFGLNLKSALGAGYLRTYTTRQEFQFKDGRYKSSTDRGNSRIMPSFTLGLGYQPKSSNSQATEFFVLYQSWLEYPYSPGFIPLMSHTNLQLGAKFYPFK